MRRSLGWAVLAVACSLGTEALSADLPARAPYGFGKQQTGEAYAGVDVTSFSYFAYAGAIFAPFGSYEDSGFRVHVLGGAGRYFYRAEDLFDTRIRGTETSGDVSLGYAFEGERYSIHFYLGPNIIAHELSQPDPTNPARGTQVGAKATTLVEVYPTDQSMIFGLAHYSTAFETYFGVVRFGHTLGISENTYFGPEFTGLGDDSFRQWRLGGHITGPSFGDSKFVVSGGYIDDSRSGAGMYGAIEVSVPF